MRIERTRNAKRNILVGVINRFVSIIIPFITRTIMIRTLGVEFLGLDSLFASILQVLNITELGVSSAIVYSMYKPIAADDDETICALLNLYRKVYRFIGIIILILGLLIIPFLPKFINNNPSFGGGTPTDINLYIVYIVFLVNAVIGYLFYGFKTAIPTAMQRLDLVTGVNTITKVISSIAQIIVLLYAVHSSSGYGNIYYIYIIILPCATILNNLIISRLVDTYYPNYTCKGQVSDDIKHVIKEKVSGLVINKICSTTRNALDSICISTFLGLALTTVYNNYYYIITSLISIIGVISSSILAGIGNSVVLESKEKNYNDFKKLNFLYMLLSGWCTIYLITLYQPFMQLWVGEVYMFPFSVVICFCAYFYVLKMGDVRATYSDAVGLWWENRYRAIAESVANILLNIILVQIWGVYGIILATVISLLIINFGIGSHIVFKYYFGVRNLYNYFFDHFKYFAITASVCLFTLFVCSTANELIGNGIFTGVTSFPLRTLAVNFIIASVVPGFCYFTIYRFTNIYKISIPWFLDRVKVGSKISKVIKPE